MTNEHVQPRSSRRLRTEEKVVTAAADLFLSSGYRATTVRRIAEVAEVSVGRVMSAGDKDVLLVRCFDRWIGRLQAGTYTPPARSNSRSRREAAPGKAAQADAPTEASAWASARRAGSAHTSTGSAHTSTRSGATSTGPGATSAVQSHLLGIFLPFLEFFADHEDLSRDYAAALMRVRGKPQVFETLAVDLQEKLSTSLVSIGINAAYARASASTLYDSYLGILFRWAASDMTLDEAEDALLRIITFHTRFRSPL